MTMLQQRHRAGEHQRPEQQQAHRVDVVGLAQLRRRQVLREVEGEHAEEAEERQPERDHARDHALARAWGAVRGRQAMQLLDRLHRLPLPVRARAGARRIMERRLVAICPQAEALRLAGRSSSPSARTRRVDLRRHRRRRRHGAADDRLDPAGGARRVAAARQHRQLGDDAGLPGSESSGRAMPPR